ncbi:MAG: S8 family serine peptidase [Allosphingosinicella sp.]
MRLIFRSRGSARLWSAMRLLPSVVLALLLAVPPAAGAAPSDAPRKGKLHVRIVLGGGATSVIADNVVPDEVIADEYIVAFGNGVAGPILYGPSPNARLANGMPGPLLYGPSRGDGLAQEAVLRSDAAERRVEERHDGSVVMDRYRAAIVGFSARLTPEAVQEIRQIPDVRVEPNRRVAAPNDGVASEPGFLIRVASPALRRTWLKIASAPVPRGLDRIDQRLVPPDHMYQARFTGAGVHVYVIDTGVLATHNEFGGRVLAGYDATTNKLGTRDCANHGTGVASVIGGRTLGVAPGVTIHPVQVFPCSGNSTVAAMVAGVNWVAQDRVTAWKNSPVVVNVSFMTLSGPQDTQTSLLNTAIANSITVGGIPYVIAAGNALPNKYAVDACTVSPALVGPAITVGNIKPENDGRVMDSNYGSCVDLFAPGVRIPAASSGGNKSTGTGDGTSFAAPHVTGVVALYLEKHHDATPSQVWAAIFNAADVKPAPYNWPGIDNPGPGSPNVLLHWGCGSDDGSVDASPPTSAQPLPHC